MPEYERYTTTPTVEAINRLNITGTVLPAEWLKAILLPSRKPDSAGCLILSEIVFWYRPKEEYDEVTGDLLGRHKRFREDKLQRSAQALADKFGYTKRQVIDALKRLEDAGYITREYRTITTKSGLTLNNVCFIEPVVARIEEISFPPTTDQRIPSHDKTHDPVRYNAHPPTPERTLQETTTRDYDKVSLSVEAQSPVDKPQPSTKKKEKTFPAKEYDEILEQLRTTQELGPYTNIPAEKAHLKRLFLAGYTVEQAKHAFSEMYNSSFWEGKPISPKSLAANIHRYVKTPGRLPDGTTPVVESPRIDFFEYEHHYHGTARCEPGLRLQLTAAEHQDLMENWDDDYKATYDITIIDEDQHHAT